MKILNLFPPNYEEVKKRFKIGIHVCFAYGEVIYNPSGDKLTEDIIRHEEVHSRQQKECGLEAWWAKYLDDAKFRFEQEIPAYQEQYKAIGEVFNRTYKRQMLDKLSRDLSGPIYGHLCTFEEAKKLIKDGLNE